MHRYQRAITQSAAQHGFTFAGRTGKGHLRWKHTSGAVVTSAATPSDHRQLQNFIRDCKRVTR